MNIKSLCKLGAVAALYVGVSLGTSSPVQAQLGRVRINRNGNVVTTHRVVTRNGRVVTTRRVVTHRHHGRHHHHRRAMMRRRAMMNR